MEPALEIDLHLINFPILRIYLTITRERIPLQILNQLWKGPDDVAQARSQRIHLTICSAWAHDSIVLRESIVLLSERRYG